MMSVKRCCFSLLLIQFIISSGCSDQEQLKNNIYYRKAMVEEINLKKNPTDYEAYLRLAQYYSQIAHIVGLNGFERMKYSKMAKETIDRAIELNPNDHRAYLFRSSVNIEPFLKIPDQAVRDIDKAIEMAPDIAETYYQKAKLLIMKGNHFNEALDAYERAMGLWEETARGDEDLNLKRLELAQLFLAADNEDNAAKLIKEIYDIGVSEEHYTLILSAYQMFYYPKNQIMKHIYEDLTTNAEYHDYQEKYWKLISDNSAITNERIAQNREIYKTLGGRN